MFRDISGEEHIGALWVEGDHRGERIGQKLIQALLRKSTRNQVYLDTKETGLISYYEKCGFEKLAKPSENLIKELQERAPHKEIDKQYFFVRKRTIE